MALSFQAALFNGGPVSLSYGMILAAFGVYAICLSLGEMAAMSVHQEWYAEAHLISIQ
jgi:amino acid permease